MKELYFTSPYRRSLRTIRLQYGQVKKVFILRTFEGNVNRRRVSEGSPREEVFEDEQELLKKVHKTKKGLLEGRLEIDYWMRNRRTIIIIGFILVVMYAFSHIEDFLILFG